MLSLPTKGVPVVRLVKVGAQDFARKPGAWSALPNQSRLDSPATNATIADTPYRGNLL